MEAKQAQGLLAWMQRVASDVQKVVDVARMRPDFAKEIGMGADGTPTMHIDHVAEEPIIRAMEHAPLNLNLVSEEAKAIQRGAPYTLIVDPVDGSRNITRGVPFYAVSMAVADERTGKIEVGLVRNLATGQVYTAAVGDKARLNGDPIQVRPFNPEDVLISASLQNDKDLAGALGKDVHIRTMGASALETCMVAHGAADAFVCRNPYLRIVDIAAAAFIVEMAGGRILDGGRKPFKPTFDPKTRLSFLAVGDPKVLEALP
jgi:myo-inositol-1(or 4)-monophosphatase